MKEREKKRVRESEGVSLKKSSDVERGRECVRKIEKGIVTQRECE